ncbi:hypothetical protein [Flavobacterium sp. LM4]|uniref:hypothetical protein n=1 Tax=Flavobacterium sp. LM4 TaxID=1938609 RepID=UPI0009937D63|nr:hypothetical protein [Flavobacterium sp. LM4]OOV20050.1 hypothetical protein BXU10_10625 [Flavobacterium sp. LM4]
MITEVLKSLAYLYYPKNICPWNQQELYLETSEYKRLQSIIDFFDSDESQKTRNTIKEEFGKDLVLKDFQDFSRLDLQDRCYTFLLTVVEDGELCSITLYMSILIPYYVVKTTIHTSQIFISKSRLEELEKENQDCRKIKDLALDIEKIIEEKLSYTKFPEGIMNNIIDDISFQDSYLGEFKMFNAFFNNQVICQDENYN